jgi:hypothetical protein
LPIPTLFHVFFVIPVCSCIKQIFVFHANMLF